MSFLVPRTPVAAAGRRGRWPSVLRWLHAASSRARPTRCGSPTSPCSTRWRPSARAGAATSPRCSSWWPCARWCWASPSRPATTKVPRERATICLAIDTSLSMEATDVTPTRIKAAQAAAKSFVNSLPDRINVGLVLFNGNASLVVSPTTDRDAVARRHRQRPARRAHRHRRSHLHLPRRHQAVPHRQGRRQVPARIVLMTDGTTNAGRSNDQAAAAAAKAKVPVVDHRLRHRPGTITMPQEPAGHPRAGRQGRPPGHRPHHRRPLLLGRHRQPAQERVPEHRQLDRLRHRAAEHHAEYGSWPWPARHRRPCRWSWASRMP